MMTRQRFYQLNFRSGPRGNGFRLLNGERLFKGGPPTFVPPRGRRGFRNYPELPVFLCDPKLGRIHRDFEGYSGYWLISDAMKSVLEATDKAAFAFLPGDMRSPDGKQCAVRWLCDVTRVVDALDEEKSTVGIGIADDGARYTKLSVAKGLCSTKKLLVRFTYLG
jgi:hypothetical protein